MGWIGEQFLSGEQSFVNMAATETTDIDMVPMPNIAVFAACLLSPLTAIHYEVVSCDC